VQMIVAGKIDAEVIKLTTIMFTVISYAYLMSTPSSRR
jgi:hypothetical protein